jgi:predicted HicB family RNase H-like nuclease
MVAHRNELIDAVRRMKAAGLRNTEIADEVDMTLPAITQICHRHGIRRPTAGRLDLPIGAKLLKALETEAGRRGVPLNRFMREMLVIVARDNLFSAILDDGK